MSWELENRREIMCEREKSMGLRIRQACCSLGLDGISLSHSFLICKMGVLVPTSLGY